MGELKPPPQPLPLCGPCKPDRLNMETEYLENESILISNFPLSRSMISLVFGWFFDNGKDGPSEQVTAFVTQIVTVTNTLS